jgi:ABC-2 type transport system ATP-binding protein
MKRRLDLAMTLVGGPRILFLDEPTTGLDPRSRRAMWSIMKELVAGGVTVFLTTQYLEEADHLADRIAVLDHGRVIAEGTPAELKRLVAGGHVRLRFTSAHDLDQAVGIFHGAARDDASLSVQVPSDGGLNSLRGVLELLDRHAITPEELSVRTPDLDDVFLALTGHPKEKESVP